MLLTFSRDVFKKKILNGEKIHTFRADPNERWRVGNSIQHWRGNPRNTKSNPHHFMDGECKYVWNACIRKTDKKHSWPGYTVTMDHHGMLLEYRNDAAALIAKNDGLTPEQFLNWFLSEKDEVYGRCIGWTDCPYTGSAEALAYWAMKNRTRTFNYDGHEVELVRDILFND